MDDIIVHFYTKQGCPLCEKGKKKLEELKGELKIPFVINEIDIYENDALLEKYQIMIPVVEIDGETVEYGIISKKETRKRLLTKIK